MALRVPQKTLEDNFKLDDFQKDFLELANLFLETTSQPKTINVLGGNKMEFIYENGKSRIYQFEKSGAQIRKVINLTDNKETIINIY